MRHDWEYSHRDVWGVHMRCSRCGMLRDWPGSEDECQMRATPSGKRERYVAKHGLEAWLQLRRRQSKGWRARKSERQKEAAE